MKKIKKSKKQVNKKDITIKIISIVAIIIVIAIASNFMNSLDTINIKTEEHEFYKYFAGEKITYTGSLKITRKNDITELLTEEGAILLDNTPIYYSNEKDSVLLPSTMLIAFPLDNRAVYKVNSLAKIYIEYGDVYLEKGSLKRTLKDSFLFDGDSVYFFIDRTTLLLNGTEYELAPLSYVNATYGGYIEIYNPESDEYFYIESTDDEIIAKTSRYEINLTLDSMVCGETEKLLTRKIKDLDNLE